MNPKVYVLLGFYENDEGERESSYLGTYTDKELVDRASDAFLFLRDPDEMRSTVVYSGYDLDSGWYEEFWSDWDWTMT